jgi:hypothetical protein
MGFHLEVEPAMHELVRFLFVGLGALSGSVAMAQVADKNTSQASVEARTFVAATPIDTMHNTGSSKSSILVPFGPYVTQTGVGGGGANVSELYTTFTLGSVGYGVFGYGMQGSLNTHVADDFTIPLAQNWFAIKPNWLVYQTGAATTGTITSMNLNLWTTDPNGQLPGGQSLSGGNQFQTQAWTGVYRVQDTSLTSINRAIIQVTCGGAWLPPLGPGTYWLEAFAGGALTSGPWAPPKTVAGQVPPTGAAWNGLQSMNGGAFAPVFDTGNPAGSIHEPGDFLFQLDSGGTCVGPCGPRPFCTSKTSSLGCAPALTSSPGTASKSGAPASTLTALPVPGGPGLPGILIYSTMAPIAPLATPFGFLCLGNFARAGAFPSTPSGTSGTCSGAYIWNVAAVAAGTTTIAVGDVLRVQAWYRDPGFPPPGDANFTHGLDGITIVP